MKFKPCLAAALAAAFALLTHVSAPVVAQTSSATILPPGKQCFQATTGVNGMVGTIGTIAGGSAYVAGTYGGVPLTGGSGSGATANITVAGGAVTAVTILNPGVQYVVGDVLSAAAASIGGTGSGFSFPVASTSINSSLAGGSVGYFVPSTLTIKQTWQNSGETVLNSNPVSLDANGCATVYGSGVYRQILKDNLGNTIWDVLTSSTGSGSGGGSATSVGDGVAVGTIMVWESPGPLPANYLYASGQAVSRTTYSNLLSALTLTQSAAVCVSGSTTLGGLTDTSQLKAGASIEGACVLPGTTVVSRTSNSVVMSNAATASISTTITFFPFGDGDGASTFNVPALNGLYLLGRCNANNIACTGVAASNFGVDPNALNAGGGGATRQITTANLPPQTPAGTIVTTVTPNSPGVSGALQNTGGTVNIGAVDHPTGSIVGITATSTFTGTPFPGQVSALLSVTPPSVTVNYIVKALPDAPASISLTILTASRLATIAPLPSNIYNNGASGVGATLTGSSNGLLSIDGTAVNAADQVLIKNEVAQSHNGIYAVAQTGDASHPYILVRTTSFDTASEMVPGTYTLVFSGLTLNGTSWVLQSPVTTVSVDPIIFNQFSASPHINLASVIVSVKDFGAVGDCVADDTTAFQNAENASFGSAGGGAVLVPPTSSCYKVSKINATNHSGVTWYGVGDQSVVKITGKDSANNWWDMSGSSRRIFHDIKFIDDGVTIPDNLFVWACTGASCATSGLLNGYEMERVNISAKANVSFLYAFGYGCVAGNACPGYGSLHLSSGTWQTANNVGATTDYLTGVQAALLHLTATNDRSVTSAYVSVVPGSATAWRGLIENMNFIDFSNGAAKANNSAVLLWNVTQLTLISGSYQCVCYMAVGQYSNTENITYIQPNFEQPNGAGGVTLGWIFMGQGSNTYTTILNGFSSDAAVAAVVLGPAISGGTLGGTWGLNIIGNNLNIEAGHRLVGIDPSGCGGWTAASNWIAASTFELQPAGVGIQTCGSVGSDTIVRGDTISVSVPGGATDNSFHIPGGVTFANPSASVGLTAVNGVASSAMRSDSAPALSQTIVPTWLGKHTFSATISNGGNISAPAWTTTGLMYSGTGGTHTDTTSSGTVATAYDNLFGQGTIAASAATTFTNYFGVFVRDPLAGTNVTLTNKWAVGGESAKFGTTGTWVFQNGGNAIGTTAAAHCLTTGLNGLTNPALDVDCSAASQASGIRLFGSATGVAPGIVATDSASNVNLSVNARGTGQTLIGNTSSGGVNLAFGGGPTVVNGLLDASAAAAGQVKFPASQNASADANTLDDYKEASFTPTVSFGGASVGVTYSSQVGVVTKVGRIVQATVNIVLTSKGSSVGTASIGTLPVASTSGTDSPCSVQINNFAAGVITTVQSQVSASSSSIGISRYAAGANTALADTDFTNTSVLKITCSYISAT